MLGLTHTLPFFFLLFFFFFFIWGVFLTHPVLASSFFWGGGEGGGGGVRGVCVGVLLHIPCWLYFHLGSFSYTSLVCFNFMWGFSLTRPFLFVCFVFNLWSFSSTSPAGFIFKRGVSLTHPVLASLLFWEFLLHIPCWLIFYLILFNFFNWGVGGIFLTHVLLAFSSSFFFFFF